MLTNMLDETIQKIAQEIASQLPTYTWQVFLIQAVLTLLAFGAGMLFGARLETNEKNLITNADLDSLQNQSRCGAESVETVKTHIERDDWRKREWANLHRTKLAALLNMMQDCEQYLDRLRNTAQESEVIEGPDPLQGLSVITTLYFPELKIEADAYLAACRAQRLAILNKWSGVKSSASSTPSIENVSADMVWTEFQTVRDRLGAAARNVTIQIVGGAV